MRVVPNLFPAFERQEVVVHTPRHARSLAELEGDELLAVAHAWSARAETARSEGFAYVHALVNEGRAAGASLAHTHSQLVWLREEPPVPAAERDGDECRVCALARSEADAHTRVVARSGGLVLLCPPAGRGPYEMMVVPEEHAADAFADPELLGNAIALAAEGVRRLERVVGRPPLNAWLHTAPFGEDGHWHFELVPRLTVLAGVELGAGIYVNAVPPEEAAQALRDASGPAGRPATSSAP